MVFSIEPEISGCSVVILGAFNPAIFHPSWLHAVGIESDISEAITHVDVVHRDIASFRVDSRNYSVTLDRFALETSTAPWIAIADITRQLFGGLLIHTPVRGFGINRTVHFNVASVEVRNKIGSKLAPVGPWGDFGAELDPDDPTLNGGLLSLTMRRRKRLDAAFLDTNAKVEPSAILTGNTGVFMEVNHHHGL